MCAGHRWNVTGETITFHCRQFARNCVDIEWVCLALWRRNAGCGVLWAMNSSLAGQRLPRIMSWHALAEDFECNIVPISSGMHRLSDGRAVEMVRLKVFWAAILSQFNG
jgi:hypothetical protein